MSLAFIVPHLASKKAILGYLFNDIEMTNYLCTIEKPFKVRIHVTDKVSIGPWIMFLSVIDSIPRVVALFIYS